MSDQQCPPLGNFARVRKVMMATTATMSVVIVVHFLLRVIIILNTSSLIGETGDAQKITYYEQFFNYLDYMRCVVWIAYLVYMSGVLNRLPNGKGNKVLGAELGRIFVDVTATATQGEPYPPICYVSANNTWTATACDGPEQISAIVGPSIVALIHLIVFAYVFFVFKKSEVNDPQEVLTACQGCPCTPIVTSPPTHLVLMSPDQPTVRVGAPVMAAPAPQEVVVGPAQGKVVMGAPVKGAQVMDDPVMGAPAVGAPPVMGAPVVGAPVTGGPISYR